MSGQDIFLTIIIILVFVAIFATNLLAIGIGNIKKQWPLYRCNPLVMPFASFFGHDTTTNFTYCIQNLQTSFMSNLLSPIHFNIGTLGDSVSQITGSLGAIRGVIDKIRSFFTNIIQSVMAVFLNLLIAIQKMLISVKDVFSKAVAIITVLMYLIQGSTKTMASAWNGLPGELVRMLCFHPDTLVKLSNKKLVKMSNICPGDKLKNGQIVCATMKLNNFENNSYMQDLYSFKGEKEKSKNCESKILVTGSHLIFYNNKFIHAKDHPDAILHDENTENLVCLITSDHTIPLGNYIFHDWEDNQQINKIK